MRPLLLPPEYRPAGPRAYVRRFREGCAVVVVQANRRIYVVGIGPYEDAMWTATATDPKDCYEAVTAAELWVNSRIGVQHVCASCGYIAMRSVTQCPECGDTEWD